MKTQEIIKEIQQLPISKRIYIIERTIHFIRKQEEQKQLKTAADALYDDYKYDNELTAFTNLDFEDFYQKAG